MKPNDEHHHRDDPAIGKSVVANGIRTNYLEAGSGEQTSC